METSHAVDSSTLNPEDAQKNNDEDDEGDDQDVEHSKSSVAALNKDCCVKTTLVSLVVTTAILLVVIVASYRKPDVATVQPKITDTVSIQNILIITEMFRCFNITIRFLKNIFTRTTLSFVCLFVCERPTAAQSYTNARSKMCSLGPVLRHIQNVNMCN